ncbi:serine/arginine-rich splicing factor 4-like [Bicyclus anynana]|uniref:Serine/arginine-rich splicing factor 4-like n=1 Tax=Bicyclus anynana TaxID=110368 RepID=A0A6J1NVB1_BICAN|nr:serine/arginine-rich splicing factor 4-like [Bicyclus anynana]
MDAYKYSPSFPQYVGYPEGFPDHGDGFGEYYDLGPMNADREVNRSGRSKQRKSRKRNTKNSRSRSRTVSKSNSRSRSRTKSRSRTRSHSQSRSRTLSRTRSRSRSRSRSVSHGKKEIKEPGFMDAFRVLYLTPSKHKKSTTKYLATKKRQDRIQELLKSDGLGSKKWRFYPRIQNQGPEPNEVPGVRDNVDQRVKVDGDFLRKYKRSKTVDADAPIAKLKRWELVLYKRLGFIQAV